LRRLAARWIQHFPQSRFRFKSLIPTLSLPDPDDQHLLAAALHARAELIITVNLKEFPAAALTPHSIVAEHSDAFVDDLFDLDARAAIGAIAKMRGRLRSPPLSPADFIDSIAQVGMPLSAPRLRRHAKRYNHSYINTRIQALPWVFVAHKLLYARSLWNERDPANMATIARSRRVESRVAELDCTRTFSLLIT
jgi:hypothetical protein